MKISKTFLHITKEFLRADRRPAINAIVDSLIGAGAPLRVLRKNKFDCSKYTEETDIKIIGTITSYKDDYGLMYSWD